MLRSLPRERTVSEGDRLSVSRKEDTETVSRNGLQLIMRDERFLNGGSVHANRFSITTCLREGADSDGNFTSTAEELGLGFFPWIRRYFNLWAVPLRISNRSWCPPMSISSLSMCGNEDLSKSQNCLCAPEKHGYQVWRKVFGLENLTFILTLYFWVFADDPTHGVIIGTSCDPGGSDIERHGVEFYDGPKFGAGNGCWSPSFADSNDG